MIIPVLYEERKQEDLFTYSTGVCSVVQPTIMLQVPFFTVKQGSWIMFLIGRLPQYGVVMNGVCIGSDCSGFLIHLEFGVFTLGKSLTLRAPSPCSANWKYSYWAHTFAERIEQESKTGPSVRCRKSAQVFHLQGCPEFPFGPPCIQLPKLTLWLYY